MQFNAIATLTMLACAGLSKSLDICDGNCHAFNTDPLKGTKRPIPCKTRTGVCPVGQFGESPTPSPPKSATGEGWYLYERDGEQFVALNVSWAPERDGTLETIQAYGMEIYKNHRGIEVHSQNFCLEKELNRSDNSVDIFNYPCYGRTKGQLIEPGDVLEVMVWPYPVSSQYSEGSNHINIKVTIPGCKDPRMKNVYKCVEQAKLYVKVNEYFCTNRSFTVSYNIPQSYGSPGNILLLGTQLASKANISNMTNIQVAKLTGLLEFGYKSPIPMSGKNYLVTLPEMYNLKVAKFTVEVYGSKNRLRFYVNAKFPAACWESPEPGKAPLGLSGKDKKVWDENARTAVLVSGVAFCAILFLAVSWCVLKRITKRRLSPTPDGSCAKVVEQKDGAELPLRESFTV